MASSKPGGASKAGVDAVQEISMMAREVEQQQDTLASQIQRVSTKIRSNAINVKRNEAALEMLKDAGPQAVTYQQVARLFILSPAPKLETSLRKHSAELEQEATKLEGLKDQLVSRLKGVDAQAAELRKSFQQTIAQALQAQRGPAAADSAPGS
ncbi:mediator complex subunit MED11 [Toxoplasma gondii ME49]|uniref:Mediator complex subunit MED11 n=15 Tax=Toxoplasma gondii TaxID=5811 RepID=B9PWZ6_TOXGV|nr:mediator complex subunit MED11 [Toxoplasma gondii ME49]EPR59090.1 mediator complex subunit MED11 [Toxoplasma gondii GT1]ESS30465.1 mediator complex subunit MED11 [Toxoplasma gondii VEG]KAF4645278.1 mediator complex subunit MED11 [Toxoplasma gondii]KFG35416.1 mediator complex subunit MED11 [Toxoplasma gondii GAB2-2007-GAL-DOM2]KFG46724.1 mediator complex subunit MED11 [Toxoplasma gondii p89]KFH06726.1 mediator complex subunit MED11 [Toxoplasma gondii VAND]KFH15063.1 mediator complex subuni|eukprot:XP_002369506.1 mediator complex subunit MED11 [Toxoplasma gondii ME49]